MIFRGTVYFRPDCGYPQRRIVELAEAEELFLHPFHPYTKALLSAVPIPDPELEKKRSFWFMIRPSMITAQISLSGKKFCLAILSGAIRENWKDIGKRSKDKMQ